MNFCVHLFNLTIYIITKYQYLIEKKKKKNYFSKYKFMLNNKYLELTLKIRRRKKKFNFIIFIICMCINRS